MAYNNELRGYISLFGNNQKHKDNHPDLTGTVVIPLDLLEQIANDPDSQITIKDQDCLKLRVVVWQQDEEPVLKGQVTKHTPRQESKPTTSKAFNAAGRRKLS